MTLTSFGPANRIARTAETHPLTWRLRDDAEPVWLEEYQAKNGYAAARKAFADMAQDDIVQTVKDAGLKGRGGAVQDDGVRVVGRACADGKPIGFGSNGKVNQAAVGYLFAQDAFDAAADFFIGFVGQPLQHMAGIAECLEVVGHGRCFQ